MLWKSLQYVLSFLVTHVSLREQFRNGRPAGWGTGKIQISNGMTFSRVAPVHPHTGRPLGEGCRWERQALDRQNFAVYAYFVP